MCGHVVLSAVSLVIVFFVMQGFQAEGGWWVEVEA